MSRVSLGTDLERNLIKKIQKGDKESFAIIYQHYLPHIRRYFFRNQTGGDVGEDLTASVFEKALKGIDNFRWQGLSLSSWLYRIARNLLIDYYRESGKRPATDSRDETWGKIASENESPEETALKNESLNFLTKLINTLPPRERRIVYLKFFEGYTNKSIAQELNLSETNVGTIIWRIIKQFRETTTLNPTAE